MRGFAFVLALFFVVAAVLLSGCTEQEEEEFWNEVLKEGIKDKTKLDIDFGRSKTATPTPRCECSLSLNTCKPNFECYIPTGRSCGTCVASNEPTPSPSPKPTWRPGNCDCTAFANTCASNEECRFLRPDSSCGKCVVKTFSWPSPVPPECQCFVGANFCNADETCTYPPGRGVCGKCVSNASPSLKPTPSVAAPTKIPRMTPPPLLATARPSPSPSALPSPSTRPTPYCECSLEKECRSGDVCESINPKTGCGYCAFRLSTPTPVGFDPTPLPTLKGARRAFVFGHSGDDIEISKDNGKTWQPAKVGTPVGGNDMVKTGFQSKIALRFETGEVVVLEELTEVRMRIFDLGSINHVELWLKAGGVMSQVNRHAAVRTEFTVKSPTATTSVRGTVFYVGYTANGETNVIVKEGQVQVKNENTGEEKYVEAGTKTTITKDAIKTPVQLADEDEKKFLPLPQKAMPSPTADPYGVDRPMSKFERWWLEVLKFFGIQPD